MTEKNSNKFLLKSLDNIMADRFGRYSKYIIQQRALPDARDGLKPVQRRILYSMWESGFKADKKFNKSAKIVGDVMGKYHPHGDSSIYEALVRLSQEWKTNVPLVEMHGNNGSIDDDPAAAMRYTETRLEKITALMLEGVEKNIVPFAPNFDDSEKEPTVLPALIPNLLMNGTKGIASGFATEIPPHNLGEILDAAIAKIKNPTISLPKLMTYIKGPDFPTGGTIYGGRGIYEAFEEGQGRISLVSKYQIKTDKNKKYIEITEIPYGVIKAKLVHDIDEIRFEKKISGIKDVIDQTSREGISIVIELENEANAEAVANYLLQKTEMQIYYSYNAIAIENYAPKLMNLHNLLDAYLNHLKDIKTKELKYDQEKFQNKLEIVQGFIKVASITEQVIKVIQESDNSKKGVVQALIENFNFTENQANAIAELKLYRLSKVDQSIYQQELQDLEAKIAFNKKLLNSEDEFNAFLIDLLQNIKKQFATPRKSVIVDEELKINVNTESLIKNEEIYLGISEKGYIKRFSIKVFDSNDLQNYKLKETDKLIYLQKISTIDKLLIFNSSGTYVFLPVHKILESKWKDLGIHINNFAAINANAKIVSIINVNSFETNAYLSLVTKKGIAKRVLIKDFETNRISKAISSIKFKQPDDELIGVKISNGLEDIIIVNNDGKAVRFSENDLPIYNTNSSGIKAISLYDNSYVVGFVLANNEDKILIGTENAKFKKMHVNNILYSARANQGKNIFIQQKNQKMQISFIEKISNSELDIWCFLQEGIEQYPVKELNYAKIDEGFSKSKVEYSISTKLNIIQRIDTKDSYWKSFNREKIDEIVNKNHQLINDTFDQLEEKLQKVDELDINYLLKKIK
ncbi:DNA topoisomerase IV subunit A [Mycoplasma iguanae]|uniref:DNA topoisomerase (ATP-hydrolyzing) n=1 Tax=Mycoplasma iguanae TaxID=292461 RepID=A0ABY5RB83_9MOLU|nr:DNA topoisomerase IV subunit A [Mycoplasma iguanae]UVD81475.1 DNA topoisomerase IV subunit A [Mycoplasma iguanae]